MALLDLTNRKSPEELNKLPKPSNEGLAKLFIGVDKIIIKDGGVYQGKAMSDKIVLTLSQTDHIQKLNDLLQIDENNTGFYCLCLGTYAIELLSNEQIKATIGWHHGVSIRYDQWNGDAGLSRCDDLLTFVAECGFTKPLEDRLEEKRNMEAGRIKERKWLDNAPESFKKYWTQINSFDDSFFDALINDLNAEIPDSQKQIITLLQTFGLTENFWTAYPMYEELPYNILKTFGTEEVITTYLHSDRNYKTRRGLGRFLCFFDFKQQRENHLKFIPVEVIDDLEKCFESIGEKDGVIEIKKLRNEKSSG